MRSHVFADVVVYHAETGRRVGMVEGFRTRSFTMCGMPGALPSFWVHAIGGAWSGATTEVMPRMDRGDRYVLDIETGGRTWLRQVAR